MIAAACTTPFDVIKTREQAVKEAAEHTQPSNPGLAAACKHDGAVAVELSNRPRQAGTFAYLRHIAETEGVQGLWRGNQARMLKVAPACAIMISSYELGKRLLQ
jgi:solute carrier family 25 protein 39/40